MTLPRWSRAVLSGLLPRERRDDVLGDLEEVHASRRRRLGAVRAFVATSAETWLLCGAFCFYRLREVRWTLPAFSTLDARLSLRLMRKNPVLALTSILALGLGLAVTAVAFAAADAALFSELSFEDGERFVRLEARRGASSRAVPLDIELYRELARAESFRGVGATDRVELNLVHDSGEVENVLGAWITPSSFGLLPYAPLLGRNLQATDGAAGAAPVVVLRESLWRRRFEARRDVVGEAIQVGDLSFRVVGVLPDGAGFPAGGEVWLPLDELYLGGSPERPRRGLSYFGVLAEGVEIGAASQEVAALAIALDAERGVERGVERGAEDVASRGALRLRVEPYLAPRPQERASAAALVVALGLLLLVIAANVANLILARTVTRRGELAVRSALGAARSRLIGQIAVEVALLGVIAAGVGLVSARFGLRWLDERIAEKPFWLHFELTPRALAFTVVATLFASVVAGVLPALRITRRDPARFLHGAGQRGGLGYGRTGAAMMAVQFALSVLLLTGALVVGRGLGSGGLDAAVELPRRQLLTARVRSPPGAADRAAEDLPSGEPLEARLRRAVEQLPGVLEVGVASSLPGRDGFEAVIAAEASEGDVGPSFDSQGVYVKAGYFESLRARAIAGRLLDEGDLDAGAAPVVVVSRPFAALHLGDRPAVGRRLWVGHGHGDEEPMWHEIVGVVPDLGLAGGGPRNGAGFFAPWRGDPPHFYLTVLAAGEPSALAGALRRAVVSVDPSLRLGDVASLEDMVAEGRALVGGFGRVLVSLGLAVLALAALGLYALVSFAVSSRTRELGLRIALGASRRDILKTVLGRTGRPLAAGVALGCGLTLGAHALRVEEKLFELPLQPAEPWVLPAVLGILVAAGLLACWLPTRRALGIRPDQALRQS